MCVPRGKYSREGANDSVDGCHFLLHWEKLGYSRIFAMHAPDVLQAADAIIDWCSQSDATSPVEDQDGKQNKVPADDQAAGKPEALPVEDKLDLVLKPIGKKDSSGRLSAYLITRS